jgi:uncharacterized protein (TIGR02996 family)
MPRKRDTLRESLLLAVCENPEDDAPRLIFADWLDEHADENERTWAEYIRLQCVLARLARDDPKRNELLRRASWLWNHTGNKGWRDSLPRGFGDHSFERGFPTDVSSSTLNFIRTARRLFRVAPVRSLRLHSLEGHLDALVAVPFLARIRELCLNAQHLGNAGAFRLARCPYLAGLEMLRVGWSDLGDEGAFALATSPVLTRLTKLDVRSNPISPAVLDSLRQRFSTGLQD